MKLAHARTYLREMAIQQGIRQGQHTCRSVSAGKALAVQAQRTRANAKPAANFMSDSLIVLCGARCFLRVGQPGAITVMPWQATMPCGSQHSRPRTQIQLKTRFRSSARLWADRFISQAGWTDDGSLVLSSLQDQMTIR